MFWEHYSEALGEGVILDAGEAENGCGRGWDNAPEGWDERAAFIAAEEGEWTG